MARSLRGMYSSVMLAGGIRMDLSAVDMRHVDMMAVNGNRGLLTIAMQRGGEKLVQKVRDEIERQGLVDSGMLRDSIRITDMNNDIRSGVTLSVGTDVYYAQYVNDGTPAVIMPKGRTLYIGGSRISEGKSTVKWGTGFVPSVKGQKAHQFFETALKNAQISDFTRR